MDKDPVQSQVRTHAPSGWPDSVGKIYKTVNMNSQYITDAYSWAIMWWYPKQGQEAVLGGLYERHPGIVRIKRLAWGYVWWSAMEFDIEDKVKGCGHCQPDRPWAQDYAGPFLGRMFLIMVDAHSKWLKYMLFRLQDQQYCHTRPTEI